MKILYIASWYPTTTNPNFGVFIKEHAHAIHQNNNEIVVLAIVIHRGKAFFSEKVTDFIDEKGVKTVLIEINTRFRDLLYHAIPLQYFFVKKTYQKILKGFKPDIVHSNVIFPAGIIGYWFSNFLSKPHVITEHWTRVRNFKEMPVLSNWAKKAYSKSMRIMPVSGFLQNEIMESYGISSDQKFKVIGNVINPDIFFYKEKTRDKLVLKLCSIATWAYLKHPAKQPELLINAISEVQHELEIPIHLTMIGGGDKVQELIQLCNDKGVDATFKGYLGKSEIVAQLHESDFFVHPTLIETFGVVVAEALLTGTPVICSNVSALKELVNSENGILVENTVADWKRAIKTCLDKTYDTKQFSDKVISRFTMEAIGKQISSVYAELVD